MNAVVVVVLICVLVVAVGAGFFAAGLATSRSRASPVDVAGALQVAVGQLHATAAADREHAIRAAVEQAVVMNSQALAARGDLIDSRLNQVRVEVRDELGRVSELVRQMGVSSARQFGAVTEALTHQAEITASLGSTTQGLREALGSTKSRGQWGERMAEDVLRLAGFVENVNYTKQSAIEGGRGLPDFTFQLPKGHVLYMDVKFPLSAYLRHLDATTEHERTTHRDTFLRDVRSRVKELSAREYAGLSHTASVDYVLMFLPNESITGFIHEHSPQLVDDALRHKVVLCSPLTLFAMLGVIRQAFDNFMVEQTSAEILKHLGSFNLQWEKFTGQIDKLGRQLESSQKAFDDLSGPRLRQLEKPLARLEELRLDRGISLDGHMDTVADLVDLGRRRELPA